MYQVFLSVDRECGRELVPVSRRGLDHIDTYLKYEDRKEANDKATEIRLAISYLINAGVKVGAHVEVKEL